jgi:hypothetical protein
MQPHGSGQSPSGASPFRSEMSEGAIYVSPNSSLLMSSRRSGPASKHGENSITYKSGSRKWETGREISPARHKHASGSGSMGSVRDSDTSGKRSWSERYSGKEGFQSEASSGNAQVRNLPLYKTSH